jgi:NRPS condensation-like uncharacterized protein
MLANRIERKLGIMEKYIYLIDKVCSFNFVIQAHIEGELQEDILRQVLDQVQERHPLLQMCIQKKSWTTLYFKPCQKKIPLRVVEAPDENWIAEAEKELYTPLPAEQGPLLRCVVLRNSAARTTLLLTFHHSIGDAMSGVYLVRDMVDAAARLIRGEDVQLPQLPLKESMESYYPASVRGMSGFFKAVGFTGRLLMAGVRWGNPVLPDVDKKVPPSGRWANIVSREISPEQMERLAAAARDNNTTIHGVLAAACTLAVLCLRQKGKQETVIVTTDCNLRGKMVPQVKDDIGFFISLCTTIEKIGQNGDFWGLAKSIRESLTQCLTREEPLILSKIVASMDLFLRLAGTGKLARRIYTSMTEGTRQDIFELSNIGVLDIEHHYGPLSINRIGFAASFSATATLGLHAATLNNCMVCNFVGMAPLYSRTHTEIIADKVIGILAEI